MDVGAFDEFIGIDWSGAKGPTLPGIQIALAKPGEAAPILYHRYRASGGRGRWFWRG